MIAFVFAFAPEIGDAGGDGHAMPNLLLLSIATTLALARVSIFMFFLHRIVTVLRQHQCWSPEAMHSVVAGSSSLLQWGDAAGDIPTCICIRFSA